MALLLSPMASITRSNRRTEGLHPHHANANAHFTATSTRTAQTFLHNPNSGRTKRPIEPSERDFDAIKSKRAKITVEILSKPGLQATKTVNTVSVTPQPPARPAVATLNPSNLPSAPASHHDAPQLTKHQEKVINGIKHELDKLQPRDADTKEQGRKLRSQEATRFKSELSAYFPDYDEVIGNDPKEHHILNTDTPIIIVQSHPLPAQNRPLALPFTTPDTRPEPHSSYDNYPVRGYGDALFGDLFDSQQIDFSFLETQYKEKTPADPLPDEYFLPAHKKAERLEKSIRNTEKGRAQHEKDQIIRLLEGLQGHDWLRTMGVSGITESRKKSFEPARAYFIKGCQAILEKFRQWNMEEKRRKAEKDRVLAEQAEAEEDAEAVEDVAVEEEEDDEAEEEEEEEEEEAVAQEADDDGVDDNASDGDPPDYSDVDASIARQLHDEAVARSRIANAGKKRSRTAVPQDPPIPDPPREFTSFFRKKYEREGALSRHRRGGRKVVAWGQPIPEIPEIDFDLPEEYRDEEILKANARRKRRDRRGSKH